MYIIRLSNTNMCIVSATTISYESLLVHLTPVTAQVFWVFIKRGVQSEGAAVGGGSIM